MIPVAKNVVIDAEGQTDLEFILERFAQKKGATLYKNVRGFQGVERVEINLIPEFLFKDKAEAEGLLVAVVGKGSFRWAGNSPVNTFALLGVGIKSIHLSTQLATLLNRLSAELMSRHTPKRRRRRKKP